MTEKNYVPAFDRDLFHLYTPDDYLSSSRKEMDEVYRMSELVLLHTESGLRLEYLTTESYDGDEYRYRLRSIFIVTKSGKTINVTEADFEKKYFETTEGTIPFSEVKMNTKGD